MSQADFLAQRWLKTEFLKVRGLDVPDGRPLHAYRCNEIEYAALSRILMGAGIGYGKVERNVAALFCLFAAEWWRRRYDGSAWGWEPALQELGAAYDWHHATAMTEKGLAFWERKLRRSARNREFLLTLVLEGGLPLGLLSAGRGRLTSHLRRVIAELDRIGPDAEQGARISEKYALELPVSFHRTEVHALIGELLCAVLLHRDTIPSSVPPSDALAWLDENAQGWRDTLPLVVEDAAAGELLAGLVRETVSLRDRGRPLVTLAERLLMHDGSAWRPMLSFTMDGVITPEGLGHQAAAVMAGAERARLRAGGDLESVISAPLALMSKAGDGRTDWRVQPLSAARTPVSWPLDAPVELNVSVGEAIACTTMATGGGQTSQAPLAFEPVENSPTHLRLIGSGSIRTRSDRLFVAARNADDLIPADEASTVRMLDAIAGTGLTLFEVRGAVRWRDGDTGLALVLRTGSDDETRSRLTVDGPAPRWDVAAPITVLGRPTLREVAAGRAARLVPITDIRWRPVNGGEWRVFPKDGSWPCGLIDVALVRAGELLDRLRLAALPATANVAVEAQGPTGGLILLSGFGNADLHIDRNAIGRNVVHGIEPVDGGAAIRLEASGEPPSRVPVVASWRGQGELYLMPRFPVRGGGFIDAGGHWLPPRARLSLDQIYGVRALAGGSVSHAEIFGWLKSQDSIEDRRLWIRHRFSGSCSLLSLRSALLNLLSASQDLDAAVEITVRSGGNESQPLRICRLDLSLSFQDETVSIDDRSRAALDEGERSRIEMVCRPIADLGAAEEPLPMVDDQGSLPSWSFSREGRSPGAWLIYGRIAGRHRFRPRAATVTGDTGSYDTRTLAGICCIADHRERQRCLGRLLNTMADDTQHTAWGEVDQSLLALQRNLPLTTLDVLRALPNKSDAMTVFLARSGDQMVEPILAMEEELPFLWTVMPLRAWMRAFVAVERDQIAQLAAAEKGDDWARKLAGQMVDDTLARIAEVQPSLTGVVFFVRERLGRPQSNDCNLTAWRHQGFRDAMTATLMTLRGSARVRNDGSTWLDWHRFRGRIAGLPKEHLDLPEYCRAVLDAPFAAARLAATGAEADGPTVRALRLCRAFDPLWFDEAYVLALGLAASEPDIIPYWSEP